MMADTLNFFSNALNDFGTSYEGSGENTAANRGDAYLEDGIASNLLNFDWRNSSESPSANRLCDNKPIPGKPDDLGVNSENLFIGDPPADLLLKQELGFAPRPTYSQILPEHEIFGIPNHGTKVEPTAPFRPRAPSSIPPFSGMLPQSYGLKDEKDPSRFQLGVSVNNFVPGFELNQKRFSESSDSSSSSAASAANKRLQQQQTGNHTDQNGEQTLKRKRFLERNRLAASKCRQKKKLWTQDLEMSARLGFQQLKHLKMIAAQLQEELRELRTQLLTHHGCNCTGVQEYLRRMGGYSKFISQVQGSNAEQINNQMNACSVFMDH